MDVMGRAGQERMGREWAKETEVAIFVYFFLLKHSYIKDAPIVLSALH
jgi:hypothetical protein